LEEAGLDELRLHPDPRDVERVLEVLEKGQPQFKVGFEIPVLPGTVKETLEFLEIVSRCECVSFVNMNELEFSESNSESLKARGYKLSNDWRSAEGSRETAIRVLEEAEKRGLRLSLHFCPAFQL
jgi:pyruvate formate-lyase activating enzyme-like uncharacterized protein